MISEDNIPLIVADLECQFLEGDAVDGLADAIMEWRSIHYNGPEQIIVGFKLYTELMRSVIALPVLHPAPMVRIYGIDVEVSPLIRNRGYILR